MKFLKLYEEFIEEGKIIARVGGVPIELKIASTEDEMKRGYMFSDGPSVGQGMLFVYQTEDILNFWMKNVSVPLDILFFDSEMNLVDYQTMYPYQNEEEIHYYSKRPAKFAIEVPHGWISNNLKDKSVKLEF
jgi:uncharacterized membrane protein (UPF0127 family)